MCDTENQIHQICLFYLSHFLFSLLPTQLWTAAPNYLEVLVRVPPRTCTSKNYVWVPCGLSPFSAAIQFEPLIKCVPIQTGQKLH